MKQKFLTLAALAGCAILAVSAVQPAAAAGRRPSDILDYTPQVGQVTNIIDGQTIQVALATGGTGTITVRYIGINAAPAGQCMGASATAANAALVLGKTVRLESDAVDASPDGTTFWRYVYLLNATMANEEMIKGGYAQAATVMPNVKHQRDLNDLEAAARASWVGGWGACGWAASASVTAPAACAPITVDALGAKQAFVPEISLLHDGDCVKIYDPTPDTGWSGTFIYHPAGSILPLSQMYLRWKDGVVAIKKDASGTFVAHVMKRKVLKYFQFGPFTRSFEVPGPDNVQIQPLTPDPGAPMMIQIQNPRTWLLQDMGNGTYKVLIDAFVYQSGDMENIH